MPSDRRGKGQIHVALLSKTGRNAFFRSYSPRAKFLKNPLYIVERLKSRVERFVSYEKRRKKEKKKHKCLV